jgi:hypothetical protein
MPEKIKVEFEIDFEEAKAIVESKISKSKTVSPKEIEELMKKGVIRASDYLMEPETYLVTSIFSKMRQFPDQVPEIFTKIDDLVKFSNTTKLNNLKWDPKKQAMYHAGPTGRLNTGDVRKS